MNWEFDLVGIIDAEDPAVRGNTDVVLINVAYFDEARQSGKGKTGWYIERIADPAGARAIAAEIDRRFANSPDETKTQPEKEFAIGFAKQIGDIGALVVRILAAVFFTHPAPDRQHDGAIDPRAHPGAGHLEDARVLRRQSHRPGARRGALLMLLGAGIGMAAAAGLLPAVNGSTGGRFPPLFVSARTWLAAAALAVAVAVAIGLPPAAPGAAAPDRRRARGAPLMAWLNQVFQITLVNLRSLPQRLGTSLVVVIGIAGVVGVLVSVLAMAEGFRHTLTSAGRPSRVIMLRSGSDSELSSGVVRDQATLLASLPGLARDAGDRPLASAELNVMVDLPRKGESHPNNVPFRGVGPAAFAVRDEVRIVEGRRFNRGVREVIVGRQAAQQFAGLECRLPHRRSGTATGRSSASSRAAATCTSRRSGPTPRWRCPPSAAPGISR